MPVRSPRRPDGDRVPPSRQVLALGLGLGLAMAVAAPALAPDPARAAPPGPSGPSGRSATASRSPGGSTARALVARCVDAYGGKAALARAAATVQEGTVTSVRHPGGVGRIGRAYARSGRLRVELEYPGQQGEIRVLDGGRGWRDGRVASGPPLDAMMLQAARLDLPALLSEWIARVEERGTLAHEGRALTVLALAIAPGLEVEAALDPESGRILRSRAASSGQPRIELVTTYSDFRLVEGVLVPFREGNWANGTTTGETVLERVTFPPRLPDELFRP